LRRTSRTLQPELPDDGLRSFVVRASLTLKLSVVVVVLLASCGGTKATDTTVALKPKITISSTTDPTSEMIAEIYGQALEKAEFRVARKKPFDTTEALYAAMAAGDVQLAGASTQGLFAWVEKQAGLTDALPATTTEQAAIIVKNLPTTLKVGVASTAEDKDVVFCAKKFADANTIATLTDLGTKPGTATLAAPDGFDTAKPLGAGVLKDTYSIEFKSTVPTTTDKIVAAVTGGTADCGVGRSADPALSVSTLTVLLDDKALVPNDVILPLVTAAAGTVDVLSNLDATSAKLTTEKLRSLMLRLKVDKAAPEVVANEFTGTAGA
jgi:osmoprotectant transport system substrate-binding protein